MTPTASGQPWTRKAVLDDLVVRFRHAGLETPLADARLLVAGALGLDRLALHTAPAELVAQVDRLRIEDFARRRLAHEPVSRILGQRWFYGRPFRVSSATLDPRPDTETIIEAAKVLFAEREALPNRILDIGTGTGCILLSLLAEFPAATGLGTDISDAALNIARSNAFDLGLANRAEFRSGVDFEPAVGRFDLIVSNPPYIPSHEIARLEPEVRDYDPPAALDGGADGLDMYRRIAEKYFSYLSEGWLILEVGHDQASAVARLFQKASEQSTLPTIRTFDDLGGVSRCVAISPRPVATR